MTNNLFNSSAAHTFCPSLYCLYTEHVQAPEPIWRSFDPAIPLSRVTKAMPGNTHLGPYPRGTYSWRDFKSSQRDWAVLWNICSEDTFLLGNNNIQHKGIIEEGSKICRGLSIKISTPAFLSPGWESLGLSPGWENRADIFFQQLVDCSLDFSFMDFYGFDYNSPR